MLELIHPFNYADVFIICVIIISMLISMRHGFVQESISLGSLVLAFVVAMLYTERAAEQFLIPRIENAQVAYVIAGVALFVATVMSGAAINYIVSSFFKHGPLRSADRLLGAMFGMARGVLIVMVLIIALAMTDTPRERWWNTSQLISQIQPASAWLVQQMPPEFEEFVVFPTL
ncbi:MAG: CvpA family protein [Pseudomonadota bacterium]